MAAPNVSDYYSDKSLETVCNNLSVEHCNIIKAMLCLSGVTQAQAIQIGLLLTAIN